MLPIAEHRTGDTMRREYGVNGQQVIVGFYADCERVTATAWAKGETIAYARWVPIRGDGRWHTLQTWRMWTSAEWRRWGIMTALWQTATDAGYTVSTEEDPLSPYSEDGWAFVKHWASNFYRQQ